MSDYSEEHGCIHTTILCTKSVLIACEIRATASLSKPKESVQNVNRKLELLNQIAVNTRANLETFNKFTN